MMLQKLRNRKNQQGYAIIIVLILLVIGTGVLVMLNRETSFFSKISGFFSRNRKIQDQAQTGFDLALNDLKILTENSLDVNSASIDKLTNLAASGGNAFNEGLYADYAGAGTVRQISPRAPGTLSKVNGDIDVKVYYFPEDPCDGTCANDDAYNIKMPKQFFVVSQATNTKSGEVFTVESHVKMRQTNMAELAMGVQGKICLDTPTWPPAKPSDCKKPFPDTTYVDYSPGSYGRTHWDLPPDQLRFVYEPNISLEDPSQMYFFHDLVTFQNPTPSGKDFPFTRLESVQGGKIKAAMMKFEEGWANKELFVEYYHPDGTKNNDYIQTNDPSNDLYFTGTGGLQDKANAGGYNLSAAKVCPAPNGFGVSQINICLKFINGQIKQYACNEKNDGFMGRVDMTIHPSDVGNSSPYFDPATTPGLLKSGAYDRYVGEHADVYTGTDSSIATLGAQNGVVYCYMSGCDCNVHVKGIIDGQVTVAANNIVVEGDLQYQHQDPLLSKDTLGLIAKNNIIIPPGIPQAATSEATQGTNWQTQTPNVDQDPPFSPGALPKNPATLAESYLGITNFIPQTAGTYEDRDIGNDEYGQYVNWAPTGKEYYNSPMALDFDGFMYAGNSVKVDGIYNPEMSPNGSMSMGFVTCEDPPACSNYRYRNPAAPDTDSNALYKADGTFADGKLPDGTPTGVKAQPLFYADGLNTNGMNIDWQSGKGKYAQYNSQFDPGEEVARPLNRLFNVFGGVTSKYYYIFDQIGDISGGSSFRMGFRRKLVKGDQRSSFLVPPGYPVLSNVEPETQYIKSFQGKSTLLP